jgi:subtilisin family serine protease
MHVTRAICSVLANPNIDPSRLVFNLSLGGDTPTNNMREVLQYAVSKKAVIAAAAGNRGIGGPRSYPAAYDINGLVSVGAAYSPNIAQQAAVTGSVQPTVTFESLPYLTNGDRAGSINWGRFSTNNAEQWVQFDFGQIRDIKSMYLYPSTAGCSNPAYDAFPVDFALESSDTGEAGSWNPVLTRVNYPKPGCTMQNFPVNFSGRYAKFRVTNSSLRLDNNKYTVGLAELEFLGTTWQPAPFSTRNTHVEITAPGTGIYSLSSSGNQQAFKGTSFSTPLVAGALALWRSKYPDWTPAQIEADLRGKAKALPYDATAVGSGMLNVSNP